MNRVMFSSMSTHWKTPAKIYETLDSEFRFTYDPCPLGGSGAFARTWVGERVFCNPPYGRGIGRWLAKAGEADCAVYLLPARTDTAWFHDYCLGADEIRFIRGRLKFSGRANNAPFPSMVVIKWAKRTNR